MAKLICFNWLAYSEIDLNESPILVLRCGHFYSVDTLDEFFQIEEYYEKKNGVFIAPKVPLALSYLIFRNFLTDPLGNLTRHDALKEVAIIQFLT